LRMNIEKESVLCSNFYGFCHGRNILSVRRSFILHLLGTFINSIYFIALIWGNGDVEERKKAV
jgi:hypothetical protein